MTVVYTSARGPGRHRLAMDLPPFVYLITFVAIALRLLHNPSMHNLWFEYLPSLTHVVNSPANSMETQRKLSWHSLIYQPFILAP